MRVGLLGGTFDPVHRGHLRLACEATERLALDRVLLAPVGRQPLKLTPPEASFSQRAAMVQRAISSGNDIERELELCLMDAPLPGAAPNFTVDLLARVRETLPEGAQIFLILGADAFAGLRGWHAPEEIVRMADLCVATRPGYVLPDADGLAALLPGSARLLGREQVGSAEALVFLCVGALLRLVELRGLDEDVSASGLRQRLREGDGIDGIAPPVAAYIREHGLYGIDKD